ncbi:DUF3159 domain-containing protein [Streptomyces coeruleorubidus]
MLFLASVLARRPPAGVLWNSTTGRGTAWRDDKRSRLCYDVVTLTLAAIFTARFVVQQYFYETDAVGSLGAAKIAMGYPLLGLGLLAVAWAARASDKHLKAVSRQPRPHEASPSSRWNRRRHEFLVGGGAGPFEMPPLPSMSACSIPGGD